MAEEMIFDFLNWQTMILELIIAGIVAFWFFWKQKQQGDKVENLVIEIRQLEENQQKFIQEQKKFQEKRRDFSIGVIRSHIADIDAMIFSIEYFKDEIRTNPSDKEVKELLELDFGFLKADLKNIMSQLTFSADVLEPHHVENIRHLVEITEQYLKIPVKEDAKPRYDGIVANAKTLLNDLPNPPV